MKRIRLTLSILVASVLGCVALNGTAAAAPQYLGVSSCTMNYDYCLATGQPQAYCWARKLPRQADTSKVELPAVC
jgi:hypothetical protein